MSRNIIYPIAAANLALLLNGAPSPVDAEEMLREEGLVPEKYVTVDMSRITNPLKVMEIIQKSRVLGDGYWVQPSVDDSLFYDVGTVSENFPGAKSDRQAKAGEIWGGAENLAVLFGNWFCLEGERPSVRRLTPEAEREFFTTLAINGNERLKYEGSDKRVNANDFKIHYDPSGIAVHLEYTGDERLPSDFIDNGEGFPRWMTWNDDKGKKSFPHRVGRKWVENTANYVNELHLKNDLYPELLKALGNTAQGLSVVAGQLGSSRAEVDSLTGLSGKGISGKEGFDLSFGVGYNSNRALKLMMGW